MGWLFLKPSTRESKELLIFVRLRSERDERNERKRVTTKPKSDRKKKVKENKKGYPEKVSWVLASNQTTLLLHPLSSFLSVQKMDLIDLALAARLKVRRWLSDTYFAVQMNPSESGPNEQSPRFETENGVSASSSPFKE